jgi:hypothetical protein
MAREPRDVWAKRVERWRASGLTADEFAAEIGVKANTLRHWSWLLGRDTRAPPPAATKRSGSRAIPFVEVVAPPSSCSPASDALEIVVRDSIRIRVPAAFDADLLRRVIAAVEVR